jgi:hypothetical protein
MQRREADELSHVEQRIVDLSETLTHCIERIEKQNSMFATQTAIQDRTNQLMERRVDMAEDKIDKIDSYIKNKESYINGAGDVIKKAVIFIAASIAGAWAVFEKFYK